MARPIRCRGDGRNGKKLAVDQAAWHFRVRDLAPTTSATLGPSTASTIQSKVRRGSSQREEQFTLAQRYNNISFDCLVLWFSSRAHATRSQMGDQAVAAGSIAKVHESMIPASPGRSISTAKRRIPVKINREKPKQHMCEGEPKSVVAVHGAKVKSRKEERQ